MKSKIFALCAAFTLMLAGCGQPDPVKVTGVTLDHTAETLEAGATLQLTATVAPENATNKNVTWSSNHEEYATVDENGLVSAIASGTAIITVKTVDGEYTASCTIEVETSVTGVTLDKQEAYLFVGESVQLNATVAPDKADDKTVSWGFTGDAVTVSDAGLVQATKLGTSVVTVTTNDGDFTASCTVHVVAYPEGTFMGAVGTFNITIALGTAKNGLVSVKVSTKDIGATSVLFDKAKGEFEIETTGKIADTYSVGKITGEYDQANDKLIKVNCDGDASAVIENAVLERPSMLIDCEKTTEELQAMFKRRFMSGSWQVDNTNTDRFTRNEDEFVSGKASVKRRGFSGGAVAVNLAADLPQLKVKNIQFWVYNPGSSNLTLRMWIYKAANLSSNAEIGSVTAVAGQWTYVAMGFGAQIGDASLYNIQIADFNNSGVYLSFDDIVLF